MGQCVLICQYVDIPAAHTLFPDPSHPVPGVHGERRLACRSMRQSDAVDERSDFHTRRTTTRTRISSSPQRFRAQGAAVGVARIAVGYCIAVNINWQCFNINRRRARPFRRFLEYYFKVTETGMAIPRAYDVRLMKMHFTHGRRSFKGKRSTPEPGGRADIKVMNITEAIRYWSFGNARSNGIRVARLR